MPSPESSRLNARRSTGPKTPEGKAASSRNSLKHGVHARQLVLPGENEEEFRNLETAFIERFQPVTLEQRFAVKRMILADWRLDRLAAMECRVLRSHAAMIASNSDLFRALQLEDAESDLPAPEPEKDEIATAWIRDGNTSNTLGKLARHQSALERSYYRALHELTGPCQSPRG